MSTSNILELAFLVCLLVIVANTSIRNTYEIRDNMEYEFTLSDKNSALTYSTSLSDGMVGADQLETDILYILLASDTDKLAHVDIAVYLDSVLVKEESLTIGSLGMAMTKISELIEEVTGGVYELVEYETEVGLSQTVVNVHIVKE